MKTATATTTTLLWTTTSTVSGFAIHPFSSSTSSKTSTVTLNGLFDGVKEAFSAPALERSIIDAERETPIDRWMGWSVVADNTQEKKETNQASSGECVKIIK